MAVLAVTFLATAWGLGASAGWRPWIVLGGGVLASIGMVWSTSRTRTTAMAQVQATTASLRKSEAEARKLALVASRTESGVLITDAAGRIEWANESFTRMSEFTPEFVQGQGIDDLAERCWTAETAARLRARMRGGLGFAGEIRARSRSGQMFWADTQVQPVRDGGGVLTNFIVVQRDITESRLAAESMKQSEERYRAIVGNIPGAVYRCSPHEGRAMHFVSNHIGALTGREAEGFILGRRWTLREMIESEDLARLDRAVEEAVRLQEPYVVEYRIRDSGGRERWVYEKGRAAYTADGEPLWLDGVLFDITDRKQAEREQASLVKAEAERNRLRETVKSMEQLLGVVAHELRTPLAGLRMTAELAMTQPGNPEIQRNCLEQMRGTAVGMSETVERMLEGAQVTGGKMTWSWGTVDLEGVCREGVRLAEALAKGTGVEVSGSVAPGCEAMKGDGAAVQRLLTNLVGNACRHTGEGRVQISVEPWRPEGGGRGVLVRVADTGRGVSVGEVRGLGEPFALSRGGMGDRQTGVLGGTGLGLFICRTIAAAHGGRIRLASELGVGTVVSAMLRTDLGWPVTGEQSPEPIEVTALEAREARAA